MTTAFTDPTVILSELFAGNVFVYCLALAAPLAGLFLLAPGLAAVVLPQLSVYALADGAGPLDPRQHYLAAIVPCLVAATVLGIARLRPKDHVPVALMVAVVSGALWAMFGPWGGAPVASSLWYHSELSPRHVAALDRAVELVPDDVPISVSNRVGARLADRRYLFVVPDIQRAEWIVFDSQDDWLPDDEIPARLEQRPEDLQGIRERIEGDPAWETVFEDDGVYVFRRVAA